MKIVFASTSRAGSRRASSQESCTVLARQVHGLGSLAGGGAGSAIPEAAGPSSIAMGTPWLCSVVPSGQSGVAGLGMGSVKIPLGLAGVAAMPTLCAVWVCRMWVSPALVYGCGLPDSMYLGGGGDTCWPQTVRHDVCKKCVFFVH